MKMKQTSCMIAALMVAGLAFGPNAQANITISSGNTPGGDNVLFNNNPPDGLVVTGILNQNNVNFNVNFSSTDLLHGNGGQARLEKSGGGDLTNVCIMLDTGYGFTQYVGNPFDATQNSMLTITVDGVDANGDPLAQLTQQLSAGNGQNFFTVLASGGDLITQICIDGTSWQDLRQNRVGGAQLIDDDVPPSEVPEPGTMALLVGMSIPGVMALRRRARK
jgi:hypothetical protein